MESHLHALPRPSLQTDDRLPGHIYFPLTHVLRATFCIISSIFPEKSIEQMIAAVVAGLMRTTLPELPLALRRRLTLPARWSGSMPEGVLAAPAQFISGSSSAEKLLRGVVEKMGREGRAVPPW
jgi:hypothetical protein